MEIASWTDIQNKTSVGYSSNECPSKSEILSRGGIEVSGSYADNECVGIDNIDSTEPQTGNWTYHVMNGVFKQYDCTGWYKQRDGKNCFVILFPDKIHQVAGSDGSDHYISPGYDGLVIKFNGKTIQEGINNGSFSCNTCQYSPYGEDGIAESLGGTWNVGDNTTSSTSMSISMSIQEYDTSSKGWDIPYNITGNKA